MKPAWMHNPPPDREVRAREALEIATRAGVNVDDIYRRMGLPVLFSWSNLTDAQLADLSLALRVAAGFYD
jgi:hypothetical protein